jgi:hypothetical protein
MQTPKRPKDKSSARSKEPRASLALRVDRAAGDLNPFLMVVTIGLLVLNLTLYLGMMATQHPFVWATSMQQSAPAAEASVTPEDWRSLPAKPR